MSLISHQVLKMKFNRKNCIPTELFHDYMKCYDGPTKRLIEIAGVDVNISLEITEKHNNAFL